MMDELQRALPKDTFSSHNGILPELIEKDHAVFILEITQTSLNYYGIVHGGAYFTMADSAAGAARRFPAGPGCPGARETENRG